MFAKGGDTRTTKVWLHITASGDFYTELISTDDQLWASNVGKGIFDKDPAVNAGRTIEG